MLVSRLHSNALDLTQPLWTQPVETSWHDTTDNRFCRSLRYLFRCGTADAWRDIGQAMGRL